MSEKLIKEVMTERTVAVITFDDGRTRTTSSSWDDSQGGRGYDGGHWGPYPTFRDRIEADVKEAQTKWDLPTATIRYTRETRIVTTVERVTKRSAFYSERSVSRA